MSNPASLINETLPLRERGFLKKQNNWVHLWEKLAEKGSAALLESAGETHEASRWIILAGNPEMDFYEEAGEAWFSGKSGTFRASFNIWEFLEKTSQAGFGGGLVNPMGTNGLEFSPRQIRDDFTPFPFCLSKAWFGIMSYEFGQSFTLDRSKKLISPQVVPDYHFFKPKTIIAYDRFTKEYFSFGEEIVSSVEKTESDSGGFEVHSLKAKSLLENYTEMVDRAQDYIANGDIYQVNLAQAFQANWKGRPGTLYRLLREMNPGPFMGLFQGRGFTVVSSSPERLTLGRGEWLETRPIAGTRPRGTNQVEDLQNQWELKTNTKEQAEHLMLVDLARNDLGRVSRFGTVEVKDFAQVESYAKVHHLVSTIQSRLSPTKNTSDVIRSLFPGGTITGCPKIRSMEIIRELEAQPRGYYTGSLGYLGPGPCFDFNILIRSFTLFSNGSLDFFAGAGIVADSDAKKEYMETLYKIEALAQALGSSFLTKS